MGLIINAVERDRRLSICHACPLVRVRVRGKCRACGEKFDKDTYYDSDAVCRCGGEIDVKRYWAKCGDCGCPLATRVYAWCPKRKW